MARRASGTSGAAVVADVRVGVVGAGFIGGRHARVLARMSGVDLAGVADSQPDRVRALAAEVGARWYPDTRTMLEDADLDALYVCVPPFARGTPELLAIERRVALFVEKPLALDAGLAEEIAAAADDAGVVTAAGYHWRHLDTVQHAADLLADTPCRLAVGAWLDRTPGTPWWSLAAGSGGQLVEQATHLFDLARVLVGEVVAVHAAGGRPDGTQPDEIDRVSAVLLRFDSGAVGTISTACLLHTGYRIGLELVCDGRVLALSEHQLIVDDGSSRDVRAAEIDPLIAEDREFIAAVQAGRAEVRVPYGDALRTHRVAIAAARAARLGITIDLEPVRA